MKILFATGSHPRHAFIARQLHKTGALAGLIIEEREIHVPQAPSSLPVATQKLFDHHFLKRAEAEEHFFESQDLPKTELHRTNLEQLNGPDVQAFIQRINPDLLLTYGVHVLNRDTLDCATGERWNIHGGLSPWYKGAITHFWPSYLLEPQMTGMTVHELTDQLDGGPIVHQNVAQLVRGDGLHELACRAVTDLASELPQVIGTLNNKKRVIKHQSTTTGRIWRSTDWHPSHLHLIYDSYNDAIVDCHLDGLFSDKPAKLHRQF